MVSSPNNNKLKISEKIAVIESLEKGVHYLDVMKNFNINKLTLYNIKRQNLHYLGGVS